MKWLKKSFRNRIFAAMLLAALIPLLICIVLMVRITHLRMDDKMQDDAAQQSAALCQSLDSLHDALTGAANRILDGDIVVHDLAGGVGNRLQINSLLFDATEDFRSYAVFDLYDVAGVCRYSTRGSVSIDLPTDWGVLYGASAQPGPVFYASEEPEDTASALLMGAIQLQAEDGCTGFLVMRVYLAGFHHLLDGKYPQSDVMILSQYFRPIFSSQTHLNDTLAPALRSSLLSGERMTDPEYVYTITRHDPTGLFVVLRQPQMFTDRTLWLLYTAGSACALVCVLVSVALTYLISQQVSYPLRRLRQAFAQVQQDDLETQVPDLGEDELGQLGQRFNRMVEALKVNRAELLRNQQELKEAQIRMLQAQLNPHFLCNTLDTMKWIGKINKVPQVATMSTNLADILRFCISAEEFVPLYREMEILDRYIEIQKLRLSDDFTYQVNIPEELYDCIVPKMILQPLVENAIVHGLGGVTGSTITIHAQETQDKRLRITVTDNGKGFPREMLGKSYEQDKKLAKGHLGLYNVDMILRRNYGEDYGLFLDSGTGGVGASVTATLPCIFEEETGC